VVDCKKIKAHCAVGYKSKLIMLMVAICFWFGF